MVISRPRGCIRGYHAQKGRRGVWAPLALVWGRRVESAVGAGRRRRSQAMWCWGGKFRWSMEMVEFLSCWLKAGARAQSCLVDWKGRAHSKLPDWMKGARALKVAWLIKLVVCVVVSRDNFMKYTLKLENSTKKTFLWILFDFLSLKTDVNVPSRKVICKKLWKKTYFLLASCQPLRKKGRSGSVRQWYGSAYPDDLYQNVIKLTIILVSMSCSIGNTEQFYTL